MAIDRRTDHVRTDPLDVVAVDRDVVGDGDRLGLLGVPLAWMLARTDLPGRRLLRAICTLSMVLPPVVGGVALFLALGRRGLIGEPLDRWFGVSLPFTTPAVVLAQVFVAMPFLVLTVDAALEQLDPRSSRPPERWAARSGTSSGGSRCRRSDRPS